MKVRYQDLTRFAIDKLIINSLEQALYQAIVVIDGEEHVVWENNNKPLMTRSMTRLQEMFETLNIPEVSLRHESPYDEMVGQPAKPESNRLEVPLGRIENPIPKRLN
jgi:hypothetical protein